MATTRMASLIAHCRPSLRIAANRLTSTSTRRNVSLVTRAMSTEGQITSDLINNMREKIEKALEAQKVEVADMQGDGRHVEIVVVSKAFDGQSAVNRQRMVYKAIWQELSETVHAVDAMVTQTPEEAGL